MGPTLRTGLVGLYVQYGCGWSAPEGWRSFDSSPTLRFERLPLLGKLYTRNASRFPARVEYGDIVRGLPFADNTVDGAFASHVLEHMPRQNAQQALRNTWRMLRPGAVFRLVVPDLFWRAAEYLKKNRGGDASASDSFLDSVTMGQRESRGLAGRLIVGLGNSSHLWMYDTPAMTVLLQRAGFIAIRECDFQDSDDPMFKLVEERDRFYASDGHKEVCLEARKSG